MQHECVCMCACVCVKLYFVCVCVYVAMVSVSINTETKQAMYANTIIVPFPILKVESDLKNNLCWQINNNTWQQTTSNQWAYGLTLYTRSFAKHHKLYTVSMPLGPSQLGISN